MFTYETSLQNIKYDLNWHVSNALHQSEQETTSSWTGRAQRPSKNSAMLPFVQSTTVNVTSKYTNYPTYAQPMATTSSPQSSKATVLKDKAHHDLRRSSRTDQRTPIGMSGVSSYTHYATIREKAKETDSFTV